MNLSLTAIDVAIGLIFVYLLMSLMCSVLQEFIANITSWRGKHLRNSVKSMLNDPTMTGLAQRLYRHPRITTLTFSGKLPSYIPSTTFAKVLVDILTQDNNLHPATDGPLAPFIRAAGGEAGKLEAELTQWFDESMDGFGGWYKRNVQLVLFLLGLVLAAALNVNSLQIAGVLWTQPMLRDAVVQSAGKFYQDGDPTRVKNPQDDEFEKLQEKLDKLHLPIGWDRESVACLFGHASGNTTSCAVGTPPPKSEPAGSTEPGVNLAWEWLAMTAGWLVTALATSVGTQFWFQTLGEALALRAAGSKPPKAAEKAAQAGAGG